MWDVMSTLNGADLLAVIIAVLVLLAIAVLALGGPPS